MDEETTQGVSDDTTLAESSGTGVSENVEETTSQAQTETITPYTDEELSALAETGEDFDRKRLTPAQAAIHKTFERGYTPKFQEAARIRDAAQEILDREAAKPQVYFDDPQKNKVFTDYLSTPSKVISEINAEITRLEGTPLTLDDGSFNPDYSSARREIAGWQGVKDEFTLKRQEVNDRKAEETRLEQSLGEEGKVLEAYAKTLGFSTADFRTKQGVRDAVRKIYEISNAGTTAKAKETKPAPQKTGKPTGEAGGGGAVTKNDLDDELNLPLEERIARSEKRSGYR